MNKKFIRCVVTIIFIFVLFLATFTIVSKTAKKTYEKRISQEKNINLDVYKMHKFARENTQYVIKALQRENAKKIRKIVINPLNVQKLLDEVDWKNLKDDNIRSFGTGSFSSKPNNKGEIDIGEQMSIKIGKKRFALYIQTITSRYGRINEGVSCIAITSFKHYDDLDYEWNWQTDDETLRVGKPFKK